MRVMQWERFFQENRIDYVTKGPNIRRGELGIRCPWCGSADPSHHMGINVENGYYSCWRNRSQHSGKSPLRLIIKLLGVSYSKARELAGLGEDYMDPEGFDAVAARLLRPDSTRDTVVERRVLHWPRGVEPITDGLRTRRHWNYLYGRGFNMISQGVEDVDRLVREYDLRACIEPPSRDENGRKELWKWGERVLIPFYQNGELVSWTGRAISKSAMLRYRDLGNDESTVPPKFTLYNHDCMLKGGRVLILQEGPFDVLKVDFYGKGVGVRSVGLATNSMSEDQAMLFKTGEETFERMIVAMDTKNELGIVDSMRMRQNLAFIRNLEITNIPFGAGDGGNLTYEQVRAWCAQL